MTSNWNGQGLGHRSCVLLSGIQVTLVKFSTTTSAFRSTHYPYREAYRLIILIGKYIYICYMSQ